MLGIVERIAAVVRMAAVRAHVSVCVSVWVGERECIMYVWCVCARMHTEGKGD